MNVNVKKTKVVIFGGKSKNPPTVLSSSTVFLYDEKPLEVVDVYKYLGCFFDKDLNFSFHISAAVRRAEKASFSLFRRIDSFRNMKISTHVSRPVGSSLWCRSVGSCCSERMLKET